MTGLSSRFVRESFREPTGVEGKFSWNTIARAYPGNYAIPDPICDTNTFAGEIPWSLRFAHPLRVQGGASVRQVVSTFETHGPQAQKGITGRAASRGIPVGKLGR